MGIIDAWRPIPDSLAAATERLTTVSSSGLATPGIADDDDAIPPSSQFSSRSTVDTEAVAGVEGTVATRAVEGAEAEEEVGPSASCLFRITRAASNVASREMAADRRAARPLREASAKLLYRSSSG